jgi:hypothetical protein
MDRIVLKVIGLWKTPQPSFEERTPQKTIWQGLYSHRKNLPCGSLHAIGSPS